MPWLTSDVCLGHRRRKGDTYVRYALQPYEPPGKEEYGGDKENVDTYPLTRTEESTLVYQRANLCFY